MEPEFDSRDVLDVAAEIERRRVQFYLRMHDRFRRSETQAMCLKLSAWRAERREHLVAERKKALGGTTGFSIPFPRRRKSSNPRMMAGLAFFAMQPGFAPKLSVWESPKGILRDAVRRTERSLIFYEGLRGFAQDAAARDTINKLISEEKDDLASLSRQREGDPWRCLLSNSRSA
jgi:rubrerythrin